MNERHFAFRVDVELHPVPGDENSGKVIVALAPDRRRYEWIEVDGSRYLYDKLDHLRLPPNILEECIRQAGGMPIYFQVPEIHSIEHYTETRRRVISAALGGFEEPPVLTDKSEEFLRRLKTDQLGFAILSIDIAGSTKLTAAMKPADYAAVIRIILFEFSEIVPKYHGHVLKYTGDGLIAYFPEPSFMRMNDLAFECALGLRCLTYHGLNPELEQRAFPRIDVRIGIDSGNAYVVTVGSPQTKQHKDIIGTVVSLATKIQSLAEPSGICVGNTALRSLHTFWRGMCEPVDPGANWPYSDERGRPYEVHRVRTAGNGGDSRPGRAPGPEAAQ